MAFVSLSAANTAEFAAADNAQQISSLHRRKLAGVHTDDEHQRRLVAILNEAGQDDRDTRHKDDIIADVRHPASTASPALPPQSCPAASIKMLCVLKLCV